MKQFQGLLAVKSMGSAGYWNRQNTVEFIGFAVKLIIIFPGLLFGYQWWWTYVIALAASFSLVWSSTVKSLPTIILFNVGWMILSIVVLWQHFVEVFCAKI